MTDATKTDALLGRTFPAQRLDGTTETIELRQLPLARYPAALALRDDEISLTALLAGRDRAWIEQLTPASYEALRAEVQSLNESGFFAYAARQAAREKERLAEMLAALAQWPPDAIELALRVGAAQANTSPTSWPTPRPKPA